MTDESTPTPGEYVFRLTYPDRTFSDVRADYAGVVTAARGGTALWLRNPDPQRSSALAAHVPADVLVVRLDQLIPAEEKGSSSD